MNNSGMWTLVATVAASQSRHSLAYQWRAMVRETVAMV